MQRGEDSWESSCLLRRACWMPRAELWTQGTHRRDLQAPCFISPAQSCAQGGWHFAFWTSRGLPRSWFSLYLTEKSITKFCTGSLRASLSWQTPHYKAVSLPLCFRLFSSISRLGEPFPWHPKDLSFPQVYAHVSPLWWPSKPSLPSQAVLSSSISPSFLFFSLIYILWAPIWLIHLVPLHIRATLCHIPQAELTWHRLSQLLRFMAKTVGKFVRGGSEQGWYHLEQFVLHDSKD